MFLSKTNDKFKRPKTEEEKMQEQQETKDNNNEEFISHTINPFNY